MIMSKMAKKANNTIKNPKVKSSSNHRQNSASNYDSILFSIHSEGPYYSQPKSLLDENERLIFIHESDASILDLSSQDKVLLFQVQQRTNDDNEHDNDTNDTFCEDGKNNKSFQIIWDEDTFNNKKRFIPRGAAICSVNIVPSIPSSTSSPKIRSSNLSNNKKQGITAGQVQIRPKCLYQKLCNNTNSTIKDIHTHCILSPSTSSSNYSNNNDSYNISPTMKESKVTTSKEAFNTPTKPTMTTTIKSPSSSSSNSKFSFSRGGGGDKIISPPISKSNYSTSTPSSGSSTTILHEQNSKTKNNHISKNNSIVSKQNSKSLIVMVPFHPNHTLSKRIIEHADTLYLRFLNNTKNNSNTDDHEWKVFTPSEIQIYHKSIHVLKRMVMAVCSDQYTYQGDIITISFQGKRIRLMVQGIESSNINHNDNIETNKIKQSLNEDSNNTSMEILHQCQMKLDDYQKILFHITHETNIEFRFDSSTTNNATMNHNQNSILSIQSNNRLGEEYKHDVVADGNYENMNPSYSENDQDDCIVAGLDSIANQMKDFLIPPLYFPDRFPQGTSMRPPRGILLYGPTGCGKTLLAKQVCKNITAQSETLKNCIIQKIDVIQINCAKIQASASIIGDAEQYLTQVFESAERNAKFHNTSTILLMDDIHLICPRRGSIGGGDGIGRITSTILALLDGVGNLLNASNDIARLSKTSHGNVVVIAVTNNPASLDPALRRAGRLDSEIEVPIADENVRCAIFKLLLHNFCKEGINVPILGHAQFMDLARLAKGFTGADCTLAMKEAVRYAILRSEIFHNDMQNSDQYIVSKIELTIEDIQRSIKVTKPSTIKSIAVEVPRVPWTSIGGMENVKRLLREAIELPLTHDHLFKSLGIPPPRGVLLYGPPGCSKTLMARALATEGKMNFLAVKGPELLSKWLGESERALASLFRRARMASPCVIFFDEIDAIASKRGGSEGSGGGERMLSQLLTELDGITIPGGSMMINHDKEGTSPPRVIVVGATNRPDLLDNALTRPGRIDRMIYVGLPDKHSREEIFRLELKTKSCDVDLHKLASDEVSGGFSGAECVSICKEAALYAIEESDLYSDAVVRPAPVVVRMAHVMQSVKGKKRQITKEMLDFYESFRRCG